MRTLISILLVIGGLAPSVVLARTEESCKTISYRAEMGAAREQGDNLLCGAVTAADLVGQKLGLGNRVSGLQVAINGFRVLADEERYPGLQSEVLEHLKKNGNPRVHQRAKDALVQKSLKLPGMFPDILAYAFSAVDFICLDDGLAPSQASKKEVARLIDRLEKSIYQKATTESLRICQRTDSALNSSDLKNVQSFISPGSFFRLAEAELNQTCKNKYKSPALEFKPVSVNCYQKDSQACIENVDQGLESGRIVGVSYFASDVMKEKMNRRGSSHTSPVVSRKYNKKSGQCEYEIRNSWGADCTEYKKEFSKKCDKGYFWVSEEVLSKMIGHSTYLE